MKTDTLMQVDIPFNIQILPKQGRIVLSGQLDGTVAVYNECVRALNDVKVPPDTRTGVPKQIWNIDASRVLLPRHGAENWMKVVRDHLHDCELIYERSQLAMVLAHTETYTHGHSTFHEDDSPPA